MSPKRWVTAGARWQGQGGGVPVWPGPDPVCVLAPPHSFFSPQVCEWKEPEELRELLDLELPSRGERPEKLLERCRAVIRHSVRTGQHPATSLVPNRSQFSPSWCKFSPVCPRFGPGWSQFSWLQFSWSQFSPSWSSFSPSWSQISPVGPSSAPAGPSLAAPSLAPAGPGSAPAGPGSAPAGANSAQFGPSWCKFSPDWSWFSLAGPS